MSEPNPYDPALPPSGESPKKRTVLITILRCCLAALMGLQLGADISLVMGVYEGWIRARMTLVGMFAAVSLGRNHLLILLVLSIAVNFSCVGYSRHKIENFCNSITPATRPSELRNLADQAGVEFSSSPDWNNPGQAHGGAYDPFTMGDFACRISFDSKHIISSRAYTH
jgi:hypothetical protein